MSCALESLGISKEKYAAMLFPLVESCLPAEILRAWERYVEHSTVESVSRSFEHHACDSTIWRHLNFEGRHLGCSGASYFSTSSTTTREDLRLGYLEYPHGAKAQYIYKHPCLLRDLNPVPTAPQAASLTPRPDLSASFLDTASLCSDCRYMQFCNPAMGRILCTNKSPCSERRFPRSPEETRRHVEEVATTSRRNRSRPNKLRRGKDTATTGFTSEEERQFTIEQLTEVPAKDPPALKFSEATQQKVCKEKLPGCIVSLSSSDKQSGHFCGKRVWFPNNFSGSLTPRWVNFSFS
ncbi:hypothetical protein TNCV_129891 [Trichonephila clavipes]|nr:hypothetical protein TNCV_129891 [Trichonephila clavipes]